MLRPLRRPRQDLALTASLRASSMVSVSGHSLSSAFGLTFFFFFQIGAVPAVMIETTFNAKGDEVTRKWLRGKFLGKGGFAEVYDIADAATGEHFAGKVIAKESLKKKKAMDKMHMEIRVHRSLVHRNIVRFVSCFELTDFFVIVLELCGNKSMMELLQSRKRLTEPEVRYYLAQMLSALKFMHAQRIIHRDLKLGNIFLSSSLEIKIGDFGLATQLTYDDERKKTVCGTPNYIAPEVLLGGEVGHSYQVDIWSLGVVLYTWLIGKPPFETSDVSTTYRRIRDSVYYFPDKVPLSDEAKDLIKRMLQKNPDMRPSLDEISQHPFFTRHLTPTQLPSTALVMEPKLPDLTKRIFSAPAIGRHDDAENVMNMGSVPSTAAMHAPTARSPRHKSPVRGAAYAGSNGGGSRKGVRVATAEKKTGSSPLGSREVNLLSGQQQLPLQAATAQPFHPQRPYQTTAAAATASRAVSAAAALAAVRGSGSSRQPRQNIVDTIYETLVSALEDQAQQPPKRGPVSTTAAPEPRVWVQRWGDYSAKYGLAYQYNTGSYGAYFNDSSIMVLDPDGKRAEYFDRQQGREVHEAFAVDNYPPELKKKVNLLLYFTNYLPQKCETVGLLTDTRAAAARAAHMPLVSVRKYLKTRHAIVFRLTDNTMQVNFTDGTAVILSDRGSVVSYVDKKHAMTTVWLSEVGGLQCAPSITSRLMYVRDMLLNLIRKRGEHGGEAGEHAAPVLK